MLSKNQVKDSSIFLPHHTRPLCTIFIFLVTTALKSSIVSAELMRPKSYIVNTPFPLNFSYSFFYTPNIYFWTTTPAFFQNCIFIMFIQHTIKAGKKRKKVVPMKKFFFFVKKKNNKKMIQNLPLRIPVKPKCGAIHCHQNELNQFLFLYPVFQCQV